MKKIKDKLKLIIILLPLTLMSVSSFAGGSGLEIAYENDKENCLYTKEFMLNSLYDEWENKTISFVEFIELKTELESLCSLDDRGAFKVRTLNYEFYIDENKGEQQTI